MDGSHGKQDFVIATIGTRKLRLPLIVSLRATKEFVRGPKIQPDPAEFDRDFGHLNICRMTG